MYSSFFFFFIFRNSTACTRRAVSSLAAFLHIFYSNFVLFLRFLFFPFPIYSLSLPACWNHATKLRWQKGNRFWGSSRNENSPPDRRARSWLTGGGRSFCCRARITFDRISEGLVANVAGPTVRPITTARGFLIRSLPARYLHRRISVLSLTSSCQPPKCNNTQR